MRPMNEPSMRCKSNFDKWGDSVPTIYFSKFKDSKYISLSSSCISYLISIKKGSSNSRALSLLISPTIFLEISFFNSTTALSLFLVFGSFKAYKCSSAPSIILLNWVKLMAFSLIYSWARWRSCSNFFSWFIV